MATRPNKKRKGRNNPPRERTVTTLTDASEGSLLPPPPNALLHDDHDPSTAAPALIAPHLSFPVSPPIATFSDQWSSLSAPPYPLSSFSNVNAFPMTPVAGPPFKPQHSSPHFFPPAPASATQPLPQSHSQSIPANPAPSQQALQPGQSDLEILERLKETIKKNQHELFRPIPQPAALASVYLGPKPVLSSSVPPHPEQIPKDVSPPGLTLLSDDEPKTNTAASAANTLSQPNSRFSQHQAPHARDTATKPTRRSSASESPKINTAEPAGKRPHARYDMGASFSHMPDPSATNSAGTKHHENGETNPPMGPPGLSRLEQAHVTRLSPDKASRSEPAPSPVLLGEPPSAKPSALNGKEGHRARDPGWGSRNVVEDRQQRHEPDKAVGGRSVLESLRMGDLNATITSNGNGNEMHVFPPRDQRIQDREKEREREREREKDRDYDRDRGRLPPREEPSRSRDDRRNDDRLRTTDSRRLSPDTRRYEPRHPPRRYDSKASDSSLTSPRIGDRSPPEPRPPRNLGEERAIIRPPAKGTVPRPSPPDERRGPPPPTADDRNARPPTADERHGPAFPPDPDRPSRLNDERRPPPPAMVDRVTRPDERRPPPAVVVADRPGIGSDDRRRPSSPPSSDRTGRSGDDRRVHIPPSPTMSVNRPARPVDDRRPVPSSGERPTVPPFAEDRRSVLASSGDRTTRPALDERHDSLEGRIHRAPTAVLPESVPSRPSIDERVARAVQPEDRNSRPTVPLEDRITRAPSLQERLNVPPARVDDRAPPRLEDRLSRPTGPPPSLEERLSTPAVPDERPLRALPDERPSRLAPPPSERPVTRASDDRNVLAEPARPPPPVERPIVHTEDRIFTPVARFARPVTPAGSDRGHPPPPHPYRAPSVAPARDEPRSFRPPSPARLPARTEVRELRPAVEARDRLSYRPGPEERYAPERRVAPTPAPPVPAAGPDLMDADPVHPHVTDTRLSYRRPSPPPAETYPPRDRAWMPVGETYREPEPVRRPPEPLPYTREWREGDRLYGDEWSERSWDRAREYDRDARFIERDAVLPAWETREERDRRTAYPPPDVPPPAPRVYERPLGSRLTDPYTDDRAYVDHGRYPPVEPPPYARVRPRSPSPLRRSGASDDLRPPLKRAREDSYSAVPYYPDDPPRGGPAEYPPRMRTPAPPPPGGAYYDDPRYPASPGSRERDYMDMRERDGGSYALYDRRADAAARMPPPPHSPPPYPRAPYGRDDRRYSVPPRA
ncbi:hypothetical protein BD414DRAFT_500441 [Trametes punicea]|nr:hypothetical protein BD414DRAFT_500441 [Trametes punicea]